jgi:hypothetical protein
MLRALGPLRASQVESGVDLAPGGDPMEIGFRQVLVIAGGAQQDTALLRRLMPTLVNYQCDVQRVPDGGNVVEYVERQPFDLVVVAFPLEQPQLPALLKSIRWRDSACRRAAVLLISDRIARRRAEGFLNRGVNRILLEDATDWELEGALRDLLKVEPRVALSLSARLDLPLAGKVERVVAQVDNLSASGMRIRGHWQLELGSPIPFELVLPGQTAAVRGTAELVRATLRAREGVVGFAVRFARFADDGQLRLEQFVERERSRAARTRSEGRASSAAEVG